MVATTTRSFPDPTVDNPFNQFLAQILRLFGIDWNPGQATVNGIPYDEYTNPGQLIFWVVRALELLEDFEQFGQYLQTNPAMAWQYIAFLEAVDWPTHIAEIASWLSSTPQLLLVPFIATVAPFGAVGGLAGLAGLAALPHPVVAAAPPPAPAAPGIAAALGHAPIAAPAPAPATAPAAAPTVSVAPSAAPAAPPPAGGPGFAPPYAIAPPGIGSASGMSASASAGAKKKAPQPDGAAATAAASAGEAARARRRQRARQRDYGDEFMDMNVDVEPDWDQPSVTTSDRGAGSLGFAGTARTAATASGLTSLAGDEFGSGPTLPMLPGTWDPDGS